MTTATAIKERPILFSGPMVQAILAGRKTVTRRIIKRITDNPYYHRFEHVDGSIGALFSEDARREFTDAGSEVAWCPYGKPGDRLWVRETWALRNDIDPAVEPEAAQHYALYRATYDGDLEMEWHPVDRWRPSIHMPRVLSRITLEITGVRVERLQDMSGEDAIREGIKPPASRRSASYRSARAKELFRNLWEVINGPDAWGANPWVWVVEFKREEK